MPATRSSRPLRAALAVAWAAAVCACAVVGPHPGTPDPPAASSAGTQVALAAPTAP